MTMLYTYTEHHFMQLREWIPLDKLKWSELSGNPKAI
jgi:hypothetical protein